MKLRKISSDIRGDVIDACIIAAVMIFIIVFPSFAADETGAEDMPKARNNMIIEENIKEDIENAEENDKENVQEDTMECTGEENTQPSAAEADEPEGYVTMNAVSGNISITN